MKQSKSARTLKSKWTKTQFLLRDHHLRRYIPETRRYSRSALLSMLRKHRMVYVKPIKGSFGLGVMRAEWKPAAAPRPYRYQYLLKKRAFATYRQLFRSMNQNKFRRPYLVQQGIHLLKYAGRRFDVRISVQRTARLPWKATGYVGRLGHPKRIVTNYHSEGKPLKLETLLSPHLKKQQIRKYRTRLQRLSVRIAKHLQRHRPNIREIGTDIAIDSKHRPWILEVNTRPNSLIFKELKNKKMFRRVMRYSKANGRYKRVKL
jgi:hypothetical protein